MVLGLVHQVATHNEVIHLQESLYSILSLTRILQHTRTIKVVGDVVDTSKFRRSKQMKGQQKREKSIEDITQTLVDRTGQEVSIPEGLSVKEFSDKVGVPLARVIQELMKNGMLVTLNSQIDFDTCFLIGETL